MSFDLFVATIDRLMLVFISSAAIFLTVITYTRIAGLRSFSKMSSFDFAMTVAVGSLIATVAVMQVSLMEGMTALAALYLLQVVIALMRRFTLFKRVIDNTPMLLMADGTMLESNMRKARVTEDDIRSKLRESNILDPASVRAVILETTGDISILSGDGRLDPSLLSGVIDRDKLLK